MGSEFGPPEPTSELDMVAGEKVQALVVFPALPEVPPSRGSSLESNTGPGLGF